MLDVCLCILVYDRAARHGRSHVKRFRDGLVFQAHRLLYHSTLGLRVMKKKKHPHREPQRQVRAGWLGERGARLSPCPRHGPSPLSLSRSRSLSRRARNQLSLASLSRLSRSLPPPPRTSIYFPGGGIVEDAVRVWRKWDGVQRMKVCGCPHSECPFVPHQIMGVS